MTEQTKKQIQTILEKAQYELLAIILSVEQTIPEPQIKSDGLLGIADACEYLKCSESHLRSMVRKGEIIERRVGDRLRFKPSELDEATKVKKARLKEVV